MRPLFWIVVLVLVLAAVTFSVNNHESVNIGLQPFLSETVSLPVYGLTLIAVFVGFVWGGLVAWIQAGKTRKRVRDLVRLRESEHREIVLLREKLAKLERVEKEATIPAPPAGVA